MELPALVAAVTRWPSREVSAVHRTYLALDGYGKAPVEPQKKMLGSVAGAAVRLAQAGPTIIVAEGIETGLSISKATGLPVWVALSAVGMETIVLPPLPLASEVILAADGDQRGVDAAQQSAERLSFEGRTVRIATAPEGRDFNDVMLEEVR